MKTTKTKTLLRSKIVGMIVGLGFWLPSLLGILKPVESASKWQLTLGTQAAIDQYRTLAILVFALGIIICIGSLKESTQRHSLVLAAILIFSLLVGRLISYFTGAVTTLLLIEIAVEFTGFILLIWALRSDNKKQAL